MKAQNVDSKGTSRKPIPIFKTSARDIKSSARDNVVVKLTEKISARGKGNSTVRQKQN